VALGSYILAVNGPQHFYKHFLFPMCISSRRAASSLSGRRPSVGVSLSLSLSQGGRHKRLLEGGAGRAEQREREMGHDTLLDSLHSSFVAIGSSRPVQMTDRNSVATSGNACRALTRVAEGTKQFRVFVFVFVFNFCSPRHSMQALQPTSEHGRPPSSPSAGSGSSRKR
jgi:hypothetical protein